MHSQLALRPDRTFWIMKKSTERAVRRRLLSLRSSLVISAKRFRSGQQPRGGKP